MRALTDVIGYARSLLVTVPLVYLATIFWGTLSLLTSLFDRTGRAQHACARWWARTLLAVSFVRVRVRGLEHLAAIDIPVAFARLPANFRIMAKASLFHIPFLGWHLRGAGHMPIARDNPLRAARSVLEAARHIREGTPVFVFPEGGRSPDGRLQEFKAGTFLLAIKAGVPVIPVTLNGTRAVLRVGSWHIHPGRVELILHPPIPTDSLQSADAESLRDRVLASLSSSFDLSSATSM
jgi:1-acyl-sn-glycerol-3-phosphate acyltransferase